MAEFPDLTVRTFQNPDYVVGHSGGADYRFHFNDFLSNFTTDNLPEGASNLYITDERVDDRVSNLIQNGNAIGWSYNDGANTLTGNVVDDPSLTESNIRLVAVSNGSFNDGQIQALNSSPQALTGATIPANGILIPIGMALRFESSGAYTNNGLEVRETSSGVTLATIPAALLNVSSGTRWIHVLFETTPTSITGQGDMQLYATTGDPTGGNGANTLQYEIVYRIVDFDAF